MSNYEVKLVLTADGSQVKVVGAQATKALHDIDDGAKAATESHNSLADAVRNIGAVVGGLYALDKIRDAGVWALEAADSYRGMAAQLSLVTSTTTELGNAQLDVFQIAQSSGVALEAVNTTYTKVTRTISEMGGGLEHSRIVTQALNDALKINRATTAEAAGAQLQFGQAIGAGVLNGEEFRSLMENATPLMQALAEELGTTTGSLKAMAAQGQLTSDVVLPAIIRASENLREQADSMGLSITASWEKITNATTRWLGEADKTYGVTQSIADSFSYLADNFDLVAGSAEGLATALVAIMAARTIGPMMMGLSGNAKSLRTTLVALGTTTTSVGSAYGGAIKTTSTFSTKLAAQKIAANAAGVAIRGLKGAMALLGGPAGVVMLAVAALVHFINRGKSAKEVSEDLSSTVQSLAGSYGELSKAQLDQKIAEMTTKLAEQTDAVKEQQQEIEQLTTKTGFWFKTVEEAREQAKRKTIDLRVEEEKLADANLLLAEMEERRLDLQNRNYAADLQAGNEKAKLAGKLEDLVGTYDKEAGKLDERKQALEDLEELEAAGMINADRKNELIKKITATTSDYKAEIKSQAEAQKEEAKTAEAQAKAYRDLLAEINPLQKASDEYAGKLETLKIEFEEGRISAEDFKAQVWALDQSFFDMADTAEESAGTVAEQADPMAKAWERGLERIDDSFSDTFKKGFSNFKEFGRNILDSLRDTLAEMAYQWAKSKFFQSISSLKGAGGIGGIVSGLVPGSASAGGSSIPGVPGAPDVGGIAGAAGAGYAFGGWAESKLGGEAQTGATLGAVAGMFLGGPVGAAIGSALGSVVGSLFGGDWNFERVNLEVEGAMVEGVQQWKKKKLTGSSFKWGDMDAELEGVLQDSFGQWVDVALSIGETFGVSKEQMDRAIDEFTANGTFALKGKDPAEIQAQLQAWIDLTGAKLLGAVVPEFTTVIQAAGDRAGELVQPLAALAAYIGEDWTPAVAMTLQQASQNSLDAVNEQLRAYDGSIEATHALSAAVSERYQIEVALLNEINGVRESVGAMVEDQKRKIERMTATSQEWFDTLSDETTALMQSLKTASTSEELNATMAQITANVGEAMSLLGEEQQREMKNQMIGLLDSAEAITQQRLDQMEAETKQDHSEVVAVAKAAIESGMGQDLAVVNAQIAAADGLQAAATSLNTSALSNNNAAGAIVQAAQFWVDSIGSVQYLNYGAR